MAQAGNAHVVDIGSAWWQDIDTPEMLAAAEKKLRVRDAGPDSTAAKAVSAQRDPVQN